MRDDLPVIRPTRRCIRLHGDYTMLCRRLHLFEFTDADVCGKTIAELQAMIRPRYVALIKRYHPDRNALRTGGMLPTGTRLSRLIRAYRWLMRLDESYFTARRRGQQKAARFSLIPAEPLTDFCDLPAALDRIAIRPGYGYHVVDSVWHT